jgi:hypothetical protein
MPDDADEAEEAEDEEPDDILDDDTLPEEPF